MLGRWPIINVLITQLCPTLCNPMDCILPGSSLHGILQARILEWVSISFSRGPSQPRDWTCISCIGRQILCHWSHLGSMTNHKYLLNKQISEWKIIELHFWLYFSSVNSVQQISFNKSSLTFSYYSWLPTCFCISILNLSGFSSLILFYLSLY